MTEVAVASEFKPFPKMARLRRSVVVTEKIDGTNAQVCILESGEILAGSRTRWVTPGDDNFGFAAWVAENETELRRLGPGRHFGEWWGSKIQRGYGLTNGERRLSLFITDRPDWPDVCRPVPVLYRGVFDTEIVDDCMSDLALEGSRAAEGFMNPEGLVVWHEHGRVGFKVTFEGDAHKGAA